jgi:recombinational DNA repair protein RecR
MADRVEDLARAFERLPGIGPRQAKRFVYHLLSAPQGDRSRMADLILHLGADVKQNACGIGVVRARFVTTAQTHLATTLF